jgi:curved DNA-binding protein CbpA
MAISEDAAAIAASNLVLAHVTAMQILSAPEHRAFGQYREGFRRGSGTTISRGRAQGGAPDRPDDAAGIQIF